MRNFSSSESTSVDIRSAPDHMDSVWAAAGDCDWLAANNVVLGKQPPKGMQEEWEQFIRLIEQRKFLLKKFQIWSSEINDSLALAICSSKAFRNLRELSIAKNNLTSKGAQVIAEHLPRLQGLWLFSNQIQDEGAFAIATNLLKLRELWINDNQIGDAGALAIVASLVSLSQLSLTNNRTTLLGRLAVKTYSASKNLYL